MKRYPNATKKQFTITYANDISYNDVQIISLGYERAPKNKPSLNTTTLMQYSLHFVLSGSGYYEIGHKIYHVTKNCVFLLFPHQNARYYPDNEHPWTYTWINFNGSKVQHLLGYTPLTPSNPVIPLSSPEIGNILLTALEYSQTEESEQKEIAYLNYFYAVLNAIATATTSAPVQSKQPEDLASKAIAYLNENYSDCELSLGSVSDALYTNPSYLSRIVKQKTGTGFSDYLVSLRITHAIKLMEQGVQYVNEISNMVGFKDPYYFSKVFKKYCNEPPKSYMLSLRAQEVPPPILRPKNK